jgi:hypothetical protein
LALPAEIYNPTVKRLPVDLSELAALLDQARRGPVRAFFDRDTGAFESMPRDAEAEGLFDDIAAAPERWIEVQPVPEAERRQLRRNFVDQEIADTHLRLRLFEALDGDRPFVRFEALLRDRPPLLDRWFAFRNASLYSLARTWLSALNIAS